MLRSAELLKEGNVGMKKKQTNKRINWIKGLTGGGLLLKKEAKNKKNISE